MKIALFSVQEFEYTLYQQYTNAHQIRYFKAHLNNDTAVMAKGFDVVCCFVNDILDAQVIETLHKFGIKLIAMRCAGYNNVDVIKATECGIKIVRVPKYSPYAVAEHAVALTLAVNRKLHKAYVRVREGNFSLNGLMGFDIHSSTVGVIGTGNIGAAYARIMAGFGAKVLAYDLQTKAELERLGVEFCNLDKLWHNSDIISLHCPLTEDTRHLINKDIINKLKQGMILINTSRGALIDTHAVIDALKLGKIGGLAIDVYEEEEELFFEDLSNVIIADDVFARLLTFPNVIVTGHQAFLTKQAVGNIAETTIANIDSFADGAVLANEVN